MFQTISKAIGIRGIVCAFGLACGVFLPIRAVSAEDAVESGKPKILFFTKSQGFEHSVVKSPSGGPSYAGRVLMEFAGKAGYEVNETKDGTVFDGDIDQYAAFVFYTTGDLTEEGKDKSPPMTQAGKQRFLDAIRGGKGFVGLHCASDSFQTKGPKWENQTAFDPYIELVGGEFIQHGAQQKAELVIVDEKFPGAAAVKEMLPLHEEWYSLKHFAKDMHVILAQQTEGMSGFEYERPAFPQTWARMHGQGRVFYSSLGHREDVWAHPSFQSLVVGALDWTTGKVDASIEPNLEAATPKADQLPVKKESATVK